MVRSEGGRWGGGGRGKERGMERHNLFPLPSSPFPPPSIMNEESGRTEGFLYSMISFTKFRLSLIITSQHQSNFTTIKKTNRNKKLEKRDNGKRYLSLR